MRTNIETTIIVKEAMRPLVRPPAGNCGAALRRASACIGRSSALEDLKGIGCGRRSGCDARGLDPLTSLSVATGDRRRQLRLDRTFPRRRHRASAETCVAGPRRWPSGGSIWFCWRSCRSARRQTPVACTMISAQFEMVQMALSAVLAIKAAANPRLLRSLGHPDPQDARSDHRHPIASSTTIPCCTTTATSSRCASTSACRCTEQRPAERSPAAAGAGEKLSRGHRPFVVVHQPVVLAAMHIHRRRPIVELRRLGAARTAPSWTNCPPDTAVATASKYPTPTSRW